MSSKPELGVVVLHFVTEIEKSDCKTTVFLNPTSLIPPPKMTPTTRSPRLRPLSGRSIVRIPGDPAPVLPCFLGATMPRRPDDGRTPRRTRGRSSGRPPRLALGVQARTPRSKRRRPYSVGGEALPGGERIRGEHMGQLRQRFQQALCRGPPTDNRPMLASIRIRPASNRCALGSTARARDTSPHARSLRPATVRRRRPTSS